MKNTILKAFLFSLLFATLSFGAGGADPSVPSPDGKQYAELIEGNNQLEKSPINRHVYMGPEIGAINKWAFSSPDNPNSNGLGQLFTLLQGHYFAWIFLLVIICVPLAFLTHFAVIGAKKFNHHAKKIKVFSKYNIIVHWCAAVPFVFLCLTGLVMVFGAQLGGGAFVRFARDVHGISTLIFTIFGPLMFLMWVKYALFKLYDIKWMMIVGGYLSKEKKPIPAGKFNAGQKMWFWVCTCGGFVMILSGAFLFFQNAGIDTLRSMALLHNILGFLIVALLITHIYMAAFAIEGALESILDGNMGEEEIAILHSYYYKELQQEGKA